MKLLYSILFLYSSMVTAFAQENPAIALFKLQQTYPQQRLYFHFDKPAYFSGENIWFKGYVFSNGFPNADARNMFIRLVDKAGNIVQEKKYPVLGATVAGNFFLADSLPQDDYYIYAFTPGLLNDNNIGWYKKTITVLNRNTVLQAGDYVTGDTISIKFFPEGGSLVAGIKSTVAFEALQEDGTPATVSIRILNAEGKEIKRASSLHDGLGKFEFNPMEGVPYTVQMSAPVKKQLKYNFPKVQKSGICLQVSDEGNLKRYTINKTGGDSLVDFVRLLVHKNHEVIFNQQLYFANHLALSGAIETSQLPSGILHFTLFDRKNLPVAERLVFVNNHEFRAPATIQWLKTDFEKRKLNTLELDFGPKLQVSGSVAITDANAVVQSKEEETIVSRLLLTEDIKGTVFNPAWYFSSSADSVQQALDLVLLSHGWKHFEWNAILKNNFFKPAPQDNPYITISGNVYTIPDNKPMKNGSLNMIFKLSNQETAYETTPVSEDGSFVIDSLIVRGPTQVLFTYMNIYGETIRANIKINVDSLNYWTNTTDQQVTTDLALKASNPFLQSKQSLQKLITKSDFVFKESNWGNGKVYKAATVNIKAKKTAAKLPKNMVDARYSSGAFTSMPRKMYDLVNEPHFNPKLSVWNYLKIYLPVDVVDGGGNLQIVSRTQFSLNTGQKWPVVVYLDENELSQGSGLRVLQEINIEEIGLVKYWAIGFVGAVGNAPGGAISIYTKRPQDRNKESASPMNKFNFDGYSVIEEFYSPDYSVKDKRHSNADTRTTLYWSPNIITDGANNKVTINFYNNDFTSSFKLVFEGFNEKGQLIHEEKIIAASELQKD